MNELLEVVERFAEMASESQSRFPAGASGDHAWLSVIDQGYILHAYFSAQGISFELYGPTERGHEHEHSDPYDGSGLSGSLDLTTLKEILRMLDRGQSPKKYVIHHARDCQVVED